MTCTTNSSRPPRITGLVQALAVVIGIPVAVLATAMGSRAIEAAYAEKHQAPVTCSVKNMTVTTVTKNGTVPGTTRQPEMTCDLTSLPGVPQRGTQYSENGYAADGVWHSFTELATRRQLAQGDFVVCTAIWYVDPPYTLGRFQSPNGRLGSLENCT